MTNKQIAILNIVALVLCVAGTATTDMSELFYVLGGLGLLVGTPLALVRMNKEDQGNWLVWTLGVTFVIFLMAVYLDSGDLGIAATAYLVFYIWSIVRLFKD